MKWFIFFLILFINNLYGFNFNIETNFTNLFDSNSSFQISFSQIDLNKINFFLLGNGKLKFKFNNWEISAFYYGEFIGKINEPTREFIQKLTNKEPITIGKNYDLLFDLEGFSVIGGKFSKILNFKNILFTLSSKILYGVDVQVGKLFGNFRRLDEKSYQFSLSLDYLYNKNYLYERKDFKKGYGLGFSFDLDLTLNLLENLLLNISFQDFYGKIYWKNIPYTVADATTDREYYDEYGNIVYRPLIQGYEGYKDYIQDIPLKIRFLMEYSINPFKLNLNFNFLKNYYFYHIKISYPLFFSRNFSFINSPYYKYYMEIPSEIGLIFSGDNTSIYCVSFYFYQVL